MKNQARSTGMTTFLIIWVGQIVSQIGSAMTGFGIAIWLFQQTEQATTLTWAGAAFFAPVVFLSPFAGTIVDRSNRKLILILTDAVAGLTTIVMLILLLQGNLQIWHVYALNFINGAFNSLQFPAFSAAITLMVDKKHYARTSGLMQLGGSASNIFAPAAAAGLIGLFGIQSVLIIDIVTFTVAIGTLLFVHIPQPMVSAETIANQGSFLQETKYGFTYILQRPSLLGLQLVFMGINLTAMFGLALLAPMILARSGNNEVALGTAQSIGAVGGVVGGLLLSVWGGPKKRTNGVLGGMLGSSVSGSLLFGIATTLPLWAVASFFSNFFLPIINGSNQAIWQAKVAPDVQGRVFSVRRLIAQVMGPIAAIIAGPMADNWFEPAMREGGALASTLGWLVGTGPGAGMGLMMVISGILGVTVALLGYMSKTIRDAERLLPDFVGN